jgi:putative membrane protein
MNKVIRIPNRRSSLPVIGMKALALVIFTMGCIWILMPDTHILSVRITPWVILMSLPVVLFFAESAYTQKTILILTTVAVSGYFIEVIGVNTGLIFGHYHYGKTLGIALFNTPLLIGINWLFLVYASASVFEKLNIPLMVKVLLASLVMLAYDIILEPVADRLDMWHFTNAVVPLLNYFGWFIIAFLFHSLLKWNRVDTRNSLAPWMLLCQFLFFITLRLFLK